MSTIKVTLIIHFFKEHNFIANDNLFAQIFAKTLIELNAHRLQIGKKQNFLEGNVTIVRFLLLIKDELFL